MSIDNLILSVKSVLREVKGIASYIKKLTIDPYLKNFCRSAKSVNECQNR
jgi:hypothetical protein